MQKDFYDQYFDSVYSSANSLSTEQYEQAADHFGTLYRGRLPENREARILDVGCGAGHFLYFLEKAGYRNYQGIDISPQQVEVCRARVTPRVEVADAFQFLADKEQAYDLIAVHDVLEHIPKDKALLFVKTVFAAITKGGSLIVRVPNMSNPLAAHGRYIDLTHELGFTERSLHQLLFVGGFRDIHLTGALLIRKRTFRSYLRRIFLKLYYAWVKFLYYAQDFSVPRILDHDLIAICRKDRATS